MISGTGQFSGPGLGLAGPPGLGGHGPGRATGFPGRATRRQAGPGWPGFRPASAPRASQAWLQHRPFSSATPPINQAPANCWRHSGARSAAPGQSTLSNGQQARQYLSGDHQARRRSAIRPIGPFIGHLHWQYTAAGRRLGRRRQSGHRHRARATPPSPPPHRLGLGAGAGNLSGVAGMHRHGLYTMQ